MSDFKRADHTILVTDSGRGSAISIIRSLGRKGYRVIAGDSNPGSPGFSSRYASETLVYPAPEQDPHAFVEALLQAARSKKIELILPVTDAAILPLSDAREQFEGVCRLVIPERALLDVVTNKQKTLDLAKRFHVPVPQTYLVDSAAEALEKADSLGWPIVLKPMTSRKMHASRDKGQAIESFTVSYAADKTQLAEQMAKLEGRCPVLLQEYYPGVGCGVELLLDRGKPLAAFQHERIREIPINGGASAFRKSVPLDPSLYEYATRMMEALCWTGLVMVEFKVGQNGPKLMEINGRVWGSLPLAVLSGMDFPARLADLYFLGSGTAAVMVNTNYKVGVHSHNLELDVLWILTALKGKRRYSFLPMPGRWAALRAMLDLFNPTYRFDILSAEDPRPGLHEVRKIFRKIGTKMKESA